MSTMGCDRCRALLDQRWDGESLDREEEAVLSSHLESCSACAQFAREIDVVLDAAAELDDLTYERAVTLAPMQIGVRTRRPILPWAASFAATVAALLLGLFLGRPPIETEPAGHMVRLVIPAPEAERVEVVGDFTGWKEPIPLQVAQDGLWVGNLEVPPGRYRYVVIVDGERMQPDPASRQVVDDGFGGKNSVLDVPNSI